MSKTIDLTLDSDEELQKIETTTGTVGAGSSRLTTTPSESRPPRTGSGPSAQTMNGSGFADNPRPRAFTSRSHITQGVRPDPMASPWTCETCTLVNQPFALACDACLSPPPRDQTSAGWVCLHCGTEVSHQFWMCSLCGSIKTES